MTQLNCRTLVLEISCMAQLLVQFGGLVMKELIAPVREASRELVRQWGFLRMSGASMSRCHALVELERHGTLLAGDLTRLLSMDKSGTSRLVARLEKEGLVDVAECDNDRRRRPLQLTEAGRKELEAVHATADEQVEAALGLLSDEQRQEVLKGLSLYAKALKRTRFSFRLIEKKDNPAIAKIMRDVLTEFNATHPGTAFHDPELDRMYETYAEERAAYWVIEMDGQIVGGGGYSPLRGGDGTVMELQKMYFTKETRGMGLGQSLIEMALAEGAKAGYQGCYLETLEHMYGARKLYERMGFKQRCAPMGDTGHCGCDTMYYRDLNLQALTVPRQEATSQACPESVSA